MKKLLLTCLNLFVFCSTFLYAQTSNTVYIGSSDGRLYAINAETGLKKWDYLVGDKVNASPTVANGIVYAGGSGSKLYALDAQTGVKKWDFYVVGGFFVSSSPTVVDGLLYIGDGTEDVYALDAQTGVQKRVFFTGASVESSPTVIGSVLYIGSNSSVQAYNAQTGVKKWSFMTGSFVNSTITVANGIAYACSFDKKIYALDAQTGVKKWEFLTGGLLNSSPTVSDGIVYARSNDGVMYALDAQTGVKRWDFPMAATTVNSSPIVSEGLVYAGSYDKKLYALDAKSGTKKWEFLTGDAISSSPTVVNGVVYVGSADQKVYAVDAKNGTKRWEFSTGGRIDASPCVVASDGKVYHSTISGTKNDYVPCSHTAQISTPGGTSFCKGAKIDLVAQVTGTTGPYTYKWSTNSTSTTLSVGQSGAYAVDITDSKGCTVSASVQITEAAALPVTISGSTTFCAGESVPLSASVSAGASPYTYQWRQNGTNLVGSVSSTLSVSTSGAYSLSVTDSKGCAGTSGALTITQKPVPNATITLNGSAVLAPGEVVVMSTPAASGQTYQWSKDGAVVSGATSNTYSASQPGSYSVTVRQNGCAATSPATVISLVLAAEPIYTGFSLTISPNPNDGICHITIENEAGKSIQLHVFNPIGQLVKAWEVKATTHRQLFSVELPASGVYIIRADNGLGKMFQKLVRQ